MAGDQCDQDHRGDPRMSRDRGPVKPKERGPKGPDRKHQPEDPSETQRAGSIPLDRPHGPLERLVGEDPESEMKTEYDRGLPPFPPGSPANPPRSAATASAAATIGHRIIMKRAMPPSPATPLLSPPSG
jgi:hypothetical protein